MALISNADVQLGRVVGESPSTGVVSALNSLNAVVNLLAWDKTTGDTKYYAPAGSAVGGGTKRHLFDREVYVDSNGAGSYVNVRAWASLTGVPTTVQGFGITNAARTDTANTFSSDNTVNGVLTVMNGVSNPSTSGTVRLPNNMSIRWRNQANTANLGMFLSTTDLLNVETGLVVAGALTVGIAALPLQAVLRGNPTQVMQLMFGDVAGGGWNAIGGRYSAGSMFLSNNSYQPTTVTDLWRQPATGAGSALLDVNYTSGLTLRFANAATADGNLATFWQAPIFTATRLAVVIGVDPGGGQIFRVGGGININGYVMVTGAGSSSTSGSMWKSTTQGLLLQSVAGSSNDFAIYNPGANVAILAVPTGTSNVRVVNGNLSVDLGTFTVTTGLGTFGAGVDITASYLRVRNFGGASASYAIVAGSSTGDFGGLGYNAVPTGTSNVYTYGAAGFASRIEFPSGGFKIRTAASGTAGANITFTDVLQVTQAGVMILGTDPGTSNLFRVGGAATFNGAVVVTASTGSTAGSVSKSTVSGLFLQSVAGSTYDFAIGNPAGSLAALAVPTGTTNVAIPNGTLTVSSDVYSSSVRVSSQVASIGANQAAFDFSGGARVLSYGANATTNGTFTVISRRSDASNSVVVLSTAVTGEVSMPFGAVLGTMATPSTDGSIWFDGTNFRGRKGGTSMTFTLT